MGTAGSWVKAVSHGLFWALFMFGYIAGNNPSVGLARLGIGVTLAGLSVGLVHAFGPLAFHIPIVFITALSMSGVFLVRPARRSLPKLAAGMLLVGLSFGLWENFKGRAFQIPLIFITVPSAVCGLFLLRPAKPIPKNSGEPKNA